MEHSFCDAVPCATMMNLPPRAGQARRALGWLAGLSALALLSACASNHSHLPQNQQAANYAAHAPGDYTPPGPAGDPWGPYIVQASTRFDVPTRWIRQVMRVESGGHEYMHGHLTVSGAGAMGLMQLEPATYREMAARYGLGPDPFNPYNNIMAGAAYIHEMYQIYGSPGFLAAYNAGPGRLDDYLDYKQPLPDQTRNYVAMIAPNIAGVYPAGQSEATQIAMNQVPTRIAPGLRPGSDETAAERLNASQLANNHPAPTPAPTQAPIRMAALTVPSVVEQQSAAPIATHSMPPVRPPRHDSGFSLFPSAEAATIAPPVAVSRPVVRTARDVTNLRTARQTNDTRIASVAQTARTGPHSFNLAAERTAPSVRSASYTVPHHAAAPTHTSTSRWGIQVGAYNTSAHAKAALGIAELSAVAVLIKGQAVIQPFATTHGRFYRARFVDLPHDQAVAACRQLNRGPTGCEVLSPDAE